MQNKSERNELLFSLAFRLFANSGTPPALPKDNARFAKGRLSCSKRQPFTLQNAVFYNAKGNLL
jgi:hypothetical protein